MTTSIYMNKQNITNKEDNGGKSSHDKEENDHIGGSKKANERGRGEETNNILEIVEHTKTNCESRRAGSGWADEYRRGANDNIASDTNHEAKRSFEVKGKVDQGGIKDSGLGILVKGVNID